MIAELAECNGVSVDLFKDRRSVPEVKVERTGVIMKCPVCGEAMLTGGTCESCGYRDGF